MNIPARTANATAGEVGGFSALPKGVYPCLIAKTEEGSSEKCGGKFYRFEMQVLSGQCQNRVFSLFLSFNHPNSDLAAETDKHYANLCAATGIRSTRHADYINKAVSVTLDAYMVKKGEKKGQLANKITNIQPRHAGPSPTTATGPMSGMTSTPPTMPPVNANPFGTPNA